MDYGQTTELIGPGALIRRLPFGPRRYLRKELLWPYLDHLADRLCRQLQAQPRLPNWIHAHYADAGYLGAVVARRLQLPLVFTGHSLGREKRRRLLEAGLDSQQIEAHYALSTRIDAEERALAQAQLVVTSTQHELDHQYARYHNFRPDRARVISPGVDSALFHPLAATTEAPNHPLVAPFLRYPQRPPLLAICRADHRKNIPALLEVFARSQRLRENHNLVLVLGCRQDLRQLDKPPREVLLQLFELIDRYDLYGLVGYPKHHTREQIPELYRWAARLGVCLSILPSPNPSGSPCWNRQPVACQWWLPMMAVPRTSSNVATTVFLPMCPTSEPCRRPSSSALATPSVGGVGATTGLGR